MKNLLLLFTILFLTVEVFPQSRKDLKLELEKYKNALTEEQQKCAELKQENDLLYRQLEKIRVFIYQATGRSQLDSLKAYRLSLPSKESSPQTTATTQTNRSGQCAAITKKGTRCSRSVQAGSNYCWQHQDNKSGNSVSDGYNGGQIWHTGPRGGQYYINSKGNKVYKKKR